MTNVAFMGKIRYEMANGKITAIDAIKQLRDEPASLGLKDAFETVNEWLKKDAWRGILK